LRKNKRCSNSGNSFNFVEIPFDIQVLATLQSGSVYYFQEDARDFSSTAPHYFVVVNIEPQTEELLILVCASSQVARRQEAIKRLGYPEETLVLMTSEDYEHFTKETVIDCNRVFLKTTREIIDKGQQGKLRICSEKMPSKIVKQLQSGLIASPKISRKVKNMLKMD